jgi:hypothetical protein
MTDTPPRHYASQMLPDLRVFCSEWMEKKGVPAEHRGLTMAHVISAVSKAKYRKRAK